MTSTPTVPVATPDPEDVATYGSGHQCVNCDGWNDCQAASFVTRTGEMPSYPGSDAKS